jgi:hypothetical protein
MWISNGPQVVALLCRVGLGRLNDTGARGFSRRAGIVSQPKCLANVNNLVSRRLAAADFDLRFGHAEMAREQIDDRLIGFAGARRFAHRDAIITFTYLSKTR